MLGPILVGGVTSLVNLIMHAVLLAGVVWTVSRQTTYATNSFFDSNRKHICDLIFGFAARAGLAWLCTSKTSRRMHSTGCSNRALF